MSENIPHSLGGFRGAFESEHGRHAAALLQSTALPDHPEQHLDMAAEIRDLFPVPAPCSALEPAWAEAMANPASVPAYVRACLDARPVGELTDGKPLPCPFCGHVGLEFKEGSTFRWIIAECGGCGASRGETRIQTFGEGTRDEWMADVQADAIQEWNTRAILAAARPQPVLEPLTDEQRNAAWHEHWSNPSIPSTTCTAFHAGIRYAEAAHGITQGEKV